MEGIKGANPFSILFRQFTNFFIILLFIAAVISYFVDGILQSLILIVIIVLNVFLGYYQEYKAEKALSDLKENFKSTSKVLRDGKIRVISSEELVTGDIVVMDTGDRVPADIRIVESESLLADESALTGESLPVFKDEGVLAINTVLADRTNILFGSTTIVGGRARGIVVSTGTATEFGKIAGLIGNNDEKTTLEKQVLFLGKILSVTAIVVCAIIFVLGVTRGLEVWSLLTFTIALLVAAVPESLPTVITLSLAIGVSRMAKKKAIVRRLAVVETLGTVNVIATDKTGTLTNNILTVGHASIIKDHKIKSLDLGSEPEKDFLNLFETAIVCSNISLKDENGDILGDPLEVAIAEAAKNFRMGLITKSRLYKREMEIPFDSAKKYMAVLANLREKNILIAKGSAESILSFCKIDEKDKKLAFSEAEKLSEQGYKVIAVSIKNLGKSSSSIPVLMTFCGLIALIDEPAEGVREAIIGLTNAGIRPIIITGDHPETARHIAGEVGLPVSDDEILTGEDLENLSESALKKQLRNIKVFARITPEDKIKIVKLLQQAGYSVAVTGDGVNDVPALKEANVGIAMGIKGTDVAKDSADIILSDDKFGTIVSAVEYGRKIYDNIRNAITFLLSANIGELFFISFAFIVDLPIPLLTIQILWINVFNDSLPAIALAFEPPTASILREKPRSTKKTSMKAPVCYAVLLALVLFVIGLPLFLWGLQFSIEKARTLVFTFAVFVPLIYCFSIRSPQRFWQNFKGFFANKFLVIAITISIFMHLAIFLQPFRKIFSVVTLNFVEIFTLIAAIVSTFFAAEFIRHYLDKRASKKRE